MTARWKNPGTPSRSRARRITILALTIGGAAALVFAVGAFVIATRIDANALKVDSSGRAVPAAIRVGVPLPRSCATPRRAETSPHGGSQANATRR